ncbi:MAG: hypothetical protein DMD72_11355 [Gemmatimonadetes bacterium]|nr:MAG: hypothetical protein DMD72_11355 [Gemmatimonadota bacterium]
MKQNEVEIPLRITLYRVPPGVRFALQKGKSDAKGNAELVPPSRMDATSLSFFFSVRVAQSKPGASPRFLGEFTQGPPDKRFVYVNSGRRAGQPDTLWDRRAKIPLTTITPALIDEVRSAPNKVLAIEIEGKGRDGGPVCASLLSSTQWRTVPK